MSSVQQDVKLKRKSYDGMFRRGLFPSESMEREVSKNWRNNTAFIPTRSRTGSRFKFDAFDLIDLVSWIQMKNHRAYLSHRKRKLTTSGVALYVLL